MPSPTYKTFSPTPNAARVPVGQAQKAWGVYLVCVLAYALIFGFWQVEPVPLEAHLLGVSIAAICLFPLALWSARGQHQMPVFEIVCLAYLLSFSNPLYLQLNGVVYKSQFFTWEVTQQALMVVALGVSSLIVGYYVSRFYTPIRFASRLDLPLKPASAQSCINWFIGLGVALTILQVVGGFAANAGVASFVRVVNSLFYVAIVLLGRRVFGSQKAASYQVVLLYSAVGIAALIGLLSGMMENALIPLVILSIARWYFTRRLPLTWLVAGFAAFILLNSVKIQYRDQVWHGNEDTSLMGKLNVWLDLSQKSVDSLAQDSPDPDPAAQASSGWQEMVRGSMSRFDQLHYFVMAYEMTPRDVPFYQGATYSYFLYGWIPRIVWPDKPIAQQGDAMFAVDYHLLSREQVNVTSMGMSQLTEAYANFGAWGVAIVMIIEGFIFALLDKLLNGPLSEGGQAIYLVVMSGFLNGIGGSASSIFLNIAPTVLTSALILRYYCTGWSAQSPQTRPRRRSGLSRPHSRDSRARAGSRAIKSTKS